jgi:hypothetical protein
MRKTKSFPVPWIPEAKARELVHEFAAVVRDYCVKDGRCIHRPESMSLEFVGEGMDVVFRVRCGQLPEENRPDEPESPPDSEKTALRLT